MEEIAGVDPADTRAYCLGDFLSGNYVWRLKVPPDRLEKLTSDCDLEKGTVADLPPKFWESFPRTWRPSVAPKNRYFSTSTLDPTAPPSDYRLCALYDPTTQHLYVSCVEGFFARMMRNGTVTVTRSP
jgi:hypothetical protein